MALVASAMAQAPDEPAAPRQQVTLPAIAQTPPPMPIRVCTKMTPPEMPRSALRDARGGRVIVRAVIRGRTIETAKVWSEAGGADFGEAALKAVRNYECDVRSDRTVTFQQEFVFGVEGEPHVPAGREGFGWHAFRTPGPGFAPYVDGLPHDECPVRAKIVFRRHHGEANVVLDPGNARHPKVVEWLTRLEPRDDYMWVRAQGQWVELPCYVFRAPTGQVAP